MEGLFFFFLPRLVYCRKSMTNQPDSQGESRQVCDTDVPTPFIYECVLKLWTLGAKVKRISFVFSQLN